MKRASPPLLIPQLLAEQAASIPNAPAACVENGQCDWRAISWQSMQNQVQALAGGLVVLGLKPGDRVGIQLGVRYEWELLQHAVLTAGGVVVGIDPVTNDEQTAHLLSVARPTTVIATDAISISRLQELCDAPIHLGIAVDDWSPQQEAQSGDHGMTCLGYRSLQEIGEPLTSILRGPDDAATILFTSGSTGVPKGIEYSHRQIMLACHAIAEMYSELEAGDRTICWLPMAHLYQRMINLLAISRGMPNFYVSDAEALLDRLPSIRPAFFAGVPRLFEKLAEKIREKPDTSQAWQSSLKYAVTGSAPIAPSVLRTLVEHDVLVLEAYGASENTIPIAASSKQHHRFGSVGRPLPQNELRFSSDGEILVKGPGLFGGYIGEPSNERFSEDGFYGTGDFGFLDEQGYFFLTGRKSEFIKTSTGRKVAPASVEAVYARAPLVDQIAVFGNGRKSLAALVTIDPAQAKTVLGTADIGSCDEQLLHDALRSQFAELEQELSGHQRIANFAVVDRPFSLRLGEITPTMKLRRERIEKVHAALIDSLYEPITSHRAPSALPVFAAGASDDRHVLVTGATGVVGSSILPLLLSEPQTVVYLLMRASSTSHLKARLRQLLEYCELGAAPSAARRIVALRGDVTRPKLGLDPEVYEKLTSKLTHIIHAAGNVRLNNDVETARRDAVAPTQRVLELSRQSPQFCKLEYVSTVGVAGRTAGRIREAPIHPDAYHNTYEAAKAEAEWLVLRQNDAGLPATIHRPSMVVGDSTTGRALTHQVFYHLADFFMGLRTGGIVPETGNVKLDIIPCDFVAQAIHFASVTPSLSGKILHLCSGPDMSPVISCLTESLRPIYESHGIRPPATTTLPLAEFREQLPKLVERADASHAKFLKSLPYFLDYLADDQTFENHQTRITLSAGDVAVPQVDAYLERIMSEYLTARAPAKRCHTTIEAEGVDHGVIGKSYRN